jgi:CDP-6-deoxy-D-xylo-4-hexulose-3-dehydrase
VDVDLDTLAMNVKSVLNSLTPRTKAVFLTHILGINGLSDELLYALDKNNVLLIEDACESHGARHNNKKVGTFGWASNFSFYYAHHMTTIEGGMISTNDYELYNLLLVLRSHGMARESNSIEYKNNIAKQYSDLNPDFIFMAPSHNMRPTEINGVLGLAQLKRLDVSIEKRHANFLRFLSLLDPKIFFTDLRIQGNSSYAFVLILRQKNLKLRNLLESKLSEQGIEFRRGLSGGGNQLRQPYLRRINSIPAPETLPNVDHVHHFAWYIGNYPDINPEIFDALKIALQDLANI